MESSNWAHEEIIVHDSRNGNEAVMQKSRISFKKGEVLREGPRSEASSNILWVYPITTHQ